MNIKNKILSLSSLALILCLQTSTILAQPPGQALPEGIRGGSEVEPEAGVEIRTYVFEETGEELPYSVYKSSKIRDGEKAPLIIALRGFTGTTLTFVRGTTVDLAEAGGYILVGPIGYNNRAGFGVGARSGPGPAPAANNDAPAPAAAPPGGGFTPPLVGGSAETDPVKVTEYSEKDVMNVLAMVREEFDIDDNRIYLMGHSQGGGGARHIAEKYPSIWAGVALLAPALFDVELTEESAILDIPLMLTVGDEDFLLDSARSFGEQMDAMHDNSLYLEYEGLDHGTIILGSQPEIFEFFGEHAR